MIMNKYNWRWNLFDKLFNSMAIIPLDNRIVASEDNIFYTFRSYGRLLLKSRWQPLFQYVDTLNLYLLY